MAGAILGAAQIVGLALQSTCRRGIDRLLETNISEPIAVDLVEHTTVESRGVRP